MGLLGAQIDLLFWLSAECLPHVKSGKLRALAVTTESRFALLPDVPTTTAAGFPSVLVTGCSGLMVPSATPKEIVAKINADLNSVMANPEMQSRLADQGFLPVTMSVVESEKFVNADIELPGKVIRDGNIKAE